MSEESVIKLLENSRTARNYYFAKDFFGFCNFYFREFYTFDTPDCLLRYYEALESGKNVYFKGFRGSAKTTIAQMYVAWCIANKFRRNIMWYSQTIDNAEENLTYIANSFIGDTDGGERFVRDYGNLYYPEYKTQNGQKKMKRIDKFITENFCYIRAMSLGTSPRGKNFTAPDGKYRPDLLIFDDVDTINSCQTKKKIDKAFEFMLNEVIGGTTNATQIIFLGNTIYEDGIVPRFEEHIKNDKNWEVIILPIKENNQIVRDRFVETDDEAYELNLGIRDSNKKYTSLESEKRRLGSISFNQNYLLIPYVRGEHIITRDMIRYDDNCISYNFDKIQIGIDPAISEKTKSDRFGICVSGFIGERRYVLECLGLEAQEKNIGKASQTVLNIYNKWKSKGKSIRLIVETVAYQAVLKTIFSQLGMAVIEHKTTNDKTTRLMEKQILFEEGKVYFNTEGTSELVDELLTFPNGEHDDRIDAMLFSITDKNKSFFISAF